MFCLNRKFLVIVLLAFFSSPASAQQAFSSQEPFQKITLSQSSTMGYNPSVPRLGLQFGSGVLVGAAGGVVGFFGGAIAAPNKEGAAGLITLGYAATGAYLGYSACSALGVYLIANSRSYNASLGSIFLGHGIGSAVGIGAMVLMNSQGPAIILALAAPIVSGMIANNMSIKKRNGPGSALFNFSDDNVALSAPSIKLEQVGNYSFSKNRAATVELLNILL